MGDLKVGVLLLFLSSGRSRANRQFYLPIPVSSPASANLLGEITMEASLANGGRLNKMATVDAYQ